MGQDDGGGVTADEVPQVADRGWPAGAAVLWAAAALAVLSPVALALAAGGFGRLGVVACLSGVALVYGVLATVALTAAVSADFEPEMPTGVPPAHLRATSSSVRGRRRSRRTATPPPSSHRRLRTSFRRTRPIPPRRRWDSASG